MIDCLADHKVQLSHLKTFVISTKSVGKEGTGDLSRIESELGLKTSFPSYYTNT